MYPKYFQKTIEYYQYLLLQMQNVAPVANTCDTTTTNQLGYQLQASRPIPFPKSHLQQTKSEERIAASAKYADLRSVRPKQTSQEKKGTSNEILTAPQGRDSEKNNIYFVWNETARMWWMTENNSNLAPCDEYDQDYGFFSDDVESSSLVLQTSGIDVVDNNKNEGEIIIFELDL